MKPRRGLKELKFYIGNPIISLTSGRLIFDDSAHSSVLAVISVPQHMDIQETLQYFSDKESLIRAARILKTEFTRHYTIVLMFGSQKDAEEFQYQYDDRLFNLLEDDRIIIKKVTSIATDHYLEHTFEAPESPKVKRKESERHLMLEDSPQAIFYLTEHYKTIQREEKEMVIKETEMQRFKDCPICLETFGEGEAVIVILCNHKFHYKCLREWRDQTCPVCRYQQYPFELTFCEKCDVHQDLWCCIICGFIGCGGPVPIAGHMQDHAIETSHIYSKPIIREVNTNRQKGLFDHSTSDFIHRVSYSNQSGSIVATESSPSDKKEKKDKDIGEEINQLIASTLDSQRQFYKQEMKKLEAEFDKVKKSANEMCSYIQSEIQSIEGEIESLNILIADGNESLDKLNSYYQILNEKLTTIKKENQKLKKAKKQREESIEKKREVKRVELAALKKQIAEKLIELKDMRTHVENKKKIDSLPVQQGSSIMLLETGSKKGKK